ncbi:MAG TPA: hypothetical protein VER55_11895, partial [Ardenticatenaceae bacterium]|nr:hypothetical protein [Ardenticatenaceae bacterium]
VRMGGGFSTLDETSISYVEACGASAWILGSIESLEAQAIPDIYADPFSVDDEIVALFLHQSRPTPEESVLSDELIVDEQHCLRVAGYAVIWPPDVWPREDGESLRIVKVAGDSEETVATVGQQVRLAGAERTPDDYRFFENKVPCEGPYWGVAAFE